MTNVGQNVAMTDMGDVSIVGAGQAGTALAHGFHRGGMRVVAVASLTPASAEALAGAVDAKATDLAGIAAAGGLVCITTPDHAVPEVATSLADLGAAQPGTRFLHTSGALGLDALDPLATDGAEVGILHPVTPLTRPEDPATLAGKPFGYDAAGEPSWLIDLVEILGGTAVSLVGVDRALYHAACVTAANLVVGLAAMAERIFCVAGVTAPASEDLAGSLILSSAGNVAAEGPSAALTGPVRRGDAAVVSRHLAALGDVDARLAETYRLVSSHLLGLMEPGPARERAAAVLEPT